MAAGAPLDTFQLSRDTTPPSNMTEKLLLVVSVTTLCMLSPGPDMLLVMRNTLTRDRRCGGLTALGVLTGNLFHIGYCTLGIALLLSQSPVAYNVLRVASAIYLVYLGVQSLRGGETATAEPTAAAGTRPTNAYWQGLVNNVLNPKGSLFYLGVFTQLITPDMSLAQTTLLIAVMVSVSAIFWIVFIQTLHLPMIRSGLANSKVAVARVFGVVLILLGVRVATLK
jgi:threonine/homoserine/homoserine lactone efflux protein